MIECVTILVNFLILILILIYTILYLIKETLPAETFQVVSFTVSPLKLIKTQHFDV